ncbi:Ubiquitin-like domain-containing protein [Aphelenchoides bicaudatus]|nr:Ubiquitin-like domain-containing protein [Aphelenchoides bicaudatus]
MSVDESNDYELEFNLRFAIQSLPDKRIKCPSSWSVLQLKQFLYEDCESKPEVEKQRLIYAGHCLKNDQILKEIFRNNSDSEALQVVHLVCASSEQIQATKQLFNKDGLRNRQQPTSSDFTSLNTSFVPTASPTFENLDQDINLAYAQAYHNYLRNYYAQSQPTNRIQFSIGRQLTAQQVTVFGGVQNPVANPQAPPVAENIVQNAEHNENPDFLDLVYKLVRFAFLAAIVFYSSLDRIIFVLFLICLMWFVQIRRERENRNGAAQNERPAPEPAQQPNNNEENNGNDNNNNELPANPAQPTENRTTAWNVFWRTFTSFFSSLIPEPINLN